MAEVALYRAYRPQKFNELVGQEQVTKPLSEAIKAGKIGHAYLFAGSRGLGKTSIARILAREVGCTEKDLYEIDAASSNSVEDIRHLTENVYTLPFESPYKVYILDEAHMLSKSAWNAFLKTLEEPPKHAIFILATTELERVPETVQSRCQVFEFKKPSRAALAKLVIDVAKKEGYTLTPDAADLVALLAEGSYRDALSVLQKVLTSSNDQTAQEGKKLTRDEVEQATGAPKRELVHALMTALTKKDKGKALAAVERAAKSGGDMRIYLELVIESLRNALLIANAPDLRDELKREIGDDEYEALAALEVTHEMLLAFITATERMRYAPIEALPLELAIFELYPE